MRLASLFRETKAALGAGQRGSLHVRAAKRALLTMTGAIIISARFLGPLGSTVALLIDERALWELDATAKQRPKLPAPLSLLFSLFPCRRLAPLFLSIYK